MGAMGMPCQRLHPLPVGTLRGKVDTASLPLRLFFFFLFPLAFSPFPSLFPLFTLSFSPLLLLLSLFPFFHIFHHFHPCPVQSPVSIIIPNVFFLLFPHPILFPSSSLPYPCPFSFPFPISPSTFPSPFSLSSSSSLFHLITFPILILVPIMLFLFPLTILIPSQSHPSPGAGGLLWWSASLHPDLHPGGTRSPPARCRRPDHSKGVLAGVGQGHTR